jgi:hypothetical protein
MQFPMSTLVAAAAVLASAWIEERKSQPAQPVQAGADVKAEADLASQDAMAEVALWRVGPVGEGAVFERTEKSVLRWTNPQVGRVYGDVHLYLKEGRPEAVVCVYRFFFPDQSLTAECTSLSEKPLVANRQKQVVWSPSEGGLKFQAVAGAPAPARDKGERLRQMRAMARDFSAELTDRRNVVTGSPQTLRLLTQPIHRYQPKDPHIQDGGLFAMVVGTDPEAFLMLESRVNDEGKSRWEFAFARMNGGAMKVRLGENVVWEVPGLTVAEYHLPQAGYVLIDASQP